MSAEVIRSFMVSLGFDVDKSSEQSFNDSLKRTAENAVKLGVAIEASAAAVTAAVVKMAQGMEQSYYASKRLGASVKDINAVEHAISQVGGSAEGAKQSMENIAAWMRRLPAGKGYIQKLIGSEFNAGDVTQIMAGLAKKFSGMSYARASQFAQMLGIDDNTLQAMMRDGGKYYEEYQRLVKKAGVDQDAYAKKSQELMQKVRGLGASFSVLSDKIGAALIGKAGPIIDKFKAWIDKNFDSITNAVTKAVDVIIKLSDAVTRFVSRAIEWYDRLDPKSKDFAKTIAAVAAAIWLFNKAFGASPVGIILALGAALVALYDDYQQWKESGHKGGIVDWEKWGPVMESVISGLKTIGGWFVTLAGDGEGGIGALQAAFALFAGYMATKWVASLLSTFGKAKLGWIALGAYIINDINKTPEQKFKEANDRQDWINDNVEDSRLGKWFGRASNTARGWFGLAPTRNPDGSVKRQPAIGGGGGGHTHGETAEGGRLVQVRTPSGKTTMVSEAHQEQFQGFLTELEEQGYKVNSLGGYANRQNVNNPNRKSEHAHGNAIDINPAQNPNGRTLVTDMPANINELAKKWGLGWGGNWKSVKDAMHFSAGEREGGRTLSPQELEALRKERQQKQAGDLVKRAAAVPSLPAMQNGGFQAPGANAVPLLPNQVSNAATLNQKTEINIMGNADANQVSAAQNAVNQNGIRNMQTAIR